jgi:glycosyltransferase involved in cell wall biosynthesis
MPTNTSRLKILFITRKWPPAIGGMETYSYELTKALKNENIELKILSLPGKEDGSPPSLLALFLFLFKSLFFILKNANQYQIIHIGDFVLAPLGFLSKLFSKKSKVVIMVHGLDILFGNRKGLLPAIYRVYQAIITKLTCSDHYIVNSDNTGLLCAQENLHPYTVIPLGVNTDLPAINIEKHNNSILFLGRLVTRKGALWFAENVLPQLDEKYKLIVVGKTWDKSEEVGLKKCERVELVGYATDELLSQLKSKCVVAVMPNQPSENNVDVEGFGLVAAEISVQGIPLIASNIEGLTSAVIDKETGFLIEHQNTSMWVNNIHKITNWSASERSEFSSKCRNKALSYYSWERVAKDTVMLYSSLIEKYDHE